MNIKDLEQKIDDNRVDDAICIIEEIGEKKFNDVVPFLINKLESTDNHMLRNAIALALSDIGSEEALEPIINMLKDPKTKGYRGTLLAALEAFDYSQYFEMIVDFLYEGNFEVSRKSLILIESVVKNIPDEIIKKCIIKIKNEIENLEEKIDFLSESLSVLTEK